MSNGAGDGCVSTVRSVLESVQDPTVSNDRLADLLSELSNDFTDANRHAMAIMTSLASQNCAASNLDDGEVALLMTELCEALLAAALENHSVDTKHLSPELREFLEGAVALTEDEEESTTDESKEEPKEEPKEESKEESKERAATEKKDELLIVEAINQPDAKPDSSEPASKVALCSCDDEELLTEFLNESVENISNAEQLMLVLEETPKDEESLHGLFRAVHSIKGAAGFCEMDQLGSLAHKAESVLARVRDGELLLKDELFDVILISIDLMSRQLHTVQANHEAKKPLEYPTSPELLLDCLIGTFETGECDASLLQEIKQILCEDEEAQEAAGQTKPSQSKAAESLRVDGKRLGLLIDLVGELVITEGVVQSELQAIDKLSAASVGARLRKVVRDVQQLSLTLKMVPIGTLLHKNKRMVRDLSEKLGKPTRVLIEGADTEVDKTLLEGLADPLVHLIRNSLDHGIEPSAADRIAAGKPEVATIRLAAEHRAGNIQITIQDDGRGLNRDVILKRAVERGLVSADHRLTDHEIDNLIFAPGFSTAAKVSEVSGRGVGMDVVRKNVEAMRGEIILSSKPGEGTEIRLEMPLTLSIIDGTVVRIGGKSFIVPTLSVIEQMQAGSVDVSETSNGTIAKFRERYISAHRLGDIIGAQHSESTPHGQVCMIVETAGTQHALFVDEILGQQPIVIKPLGSILECFDFYAGGALLSDGEIAFVLDLNAVCKKTTSV